MPDERWELGRVWTALEESGLFDRELIRYYSKLEHSPSEAFHLAKSGFEEQISLLSGSAHDINSDASKAPLVLAHLILAIYSSLSRGDTTFIPLPRLEGKSWPEQETALLTWSAQHGMSDDRMIGKK
ncbi:MAG TPA: hypothetical protein VMS12_07215 [Thermoanaerobaculia bacterium]|nr:hypothetical protein [Thermoanaerobaculia bacterium]